jgi:hypothetical protein
MKRPPISGDNSKIKAAEQQARVVELRRRRLTFAEIGQTMGFTAQRAHQIYNDALKAVPALQVDEHRVEELTLVDDAIASLWDIAHNAKQPRTAVEAWTSIRGWAERKAKLLGLDTPVKQELTVDGGIRYEIVGVDLDTD